jgi:hypothetical protein
MLSYAISLAEQPTPKVKSERLRAFMTVLIKRTRRSSISLLGKSIIDPRRYVSERLSDALF